MRVRVLASTQQQARVLRTHAASSLVFDRCVCRAGGDPVEAMRRARIFALSKASTNSQLTSAVDASVRDFLALASPNSKHKSKLNAMDAIGLIQLCRKAARPSHISQIWPHIQQLSLLPAKDNRTSSTLIGCVVSCTLEAKDSTTAASLWRYLCSCPHLPLVESVATQLISALRGQPGLVVELITALQNGSHGVRANAQHFSVAVQALADAPNAAKEVFQLAVKYNKVSAVTLVVWCQVLQQHRNFDAALNTLAIADTLSIVPVATHYTVLLSCAAEMKNLKATQLIHKHLGEHAAANRNPVTITALMHSYAQCGDFETALHTFEQARENKQVDGVMLAVLCQVFRHCKDLKAALNTLSIADSLSISPTPSHYTQLLSCAAELNSLAATKLIHQHLDKHPTVANNIVTSSLVHSYAACGDLETAVSVFDAGLQAALITDAQGWTSLLNAYAMHGMFKEANATLERMIVAGVKPNGTTALCLLNAASHAGLGLGVRQLYQRLQTRFPELELGTLQHRTCVVDGLARVGLFEEAVAEARSAEFEVAWIAVLGAARSHNRLDIGELAFHEIKRLCTDDTILASSLVLMSHIYTANGRDEEAAQMRQYIKDNRLRRPVGESAIEVDGVMHTFRVNDTSHPEMKQIIELNDKLHEQLKADGYVPDIMWASRGAGVSTQSKEQALCEHSERFALVYGLLHSDEGQPLTIFKNLRVCGDCHDATKHASKVLNRKLTVKDFNRWHVFENGKCSCGDFW